MLPSAQPVPVTQLLASVTDLVKPVLQLGCTPAHQNTTLAAADIMLESRCQPFEATLGDQMGSSSVIPISHSEQSATTTVLSLLTEPPVSIANYLAAPQLTVQLGLLDDQLVPAVHQLAGQGDLIGGKQVRHHQELPQLDQHCYQHNTF
jgi:hypothetical protein